MAAASLPASISILLNSQLTNPEVKTRVTASDMTVIFILSFTMIVTGISLSQWIPILTFTSR